MGGTAALYLLDDKHGRDREPYNKKIDKICRFAESCIWDEGIGYERSDSGKQGKGFGNGKKRYPEKV